MSAPRPAESTKGTPDMSMTRRGLEANSARAWRNWLTVNASSSPTGRQMVMALRRLVLLDVEHTASWVATTGDVVWMVPMCGRRIPSRS